MVGVEVRSQRFQRRIEEEWRTEFFSRAPSFRWVSQLPDLSVPMSFELHSSHRFSSTHLNLVLKAISSELCALPLLWPLPFVIRTHSAKIRVSSWRRKNKLLSLVLLDFYLVLPQNCMILCQENGNLTTCLCVISVGPFSTLYLHWYSIPNKKNVFKKAGCPELLSTCFRSLESLGATLKNSKFQLNVFKIFRQGNKRSLFVYSMFTPQCNSLTWKMKDISILS